VGKTLASILAFCGLLFSLPALGANKAERLNFDFAGHKRTIYFFVPEEGGRLPAVVLLHGSGRNGEIMVDQWRDLAKREGIVLVAPDAYDPVGWNPKDDPPGFLHSSVQQVAARHPIDLNRIYLFGHSSGAEYALLLAILDSHYFAAVAVHAGSIAEANFKLFAYAGRRLPVGFWIGDRDPLFSLDTVKATKRAFDQNGFPTQLTVLPNHDHNYYAISDLVNAQAWQFLMHTQLQPPAAIKQSTQ